MWVVVRVSDQEGDDRDVGDANCRGDDLCTNLIGGRSGMEMLAIIEAHCRFAAGQLPRGQEGCATAFALLAAFPGACARNLPDITGTTPDVFVALVRFGVLPAVPSRRVRLAAIRLLAGVTPIVELRSQRQWSLWFAQALDPTSAAAQGLQAGTSDSQRAVRDPGETFTAARARDHRRERSEMLRATQVARAEADAARESLTQNVAALEATRLRVSELEAQIEGARRDEAKRLATAHERLEDDRRLLAELRRQRDTDQAQLRALQEGEAARRQELARMRAQREADRQELARLRQHEVATEAYAESNATVAKLREEVATTTRAMATRDVKLRDAVGNVTRLEQLLGAAQRDLGAVVRARDETGKQLTAARSDNELLQAEAATRQAALVERSRQLAALAKQRDESVAECKRLREQLERESALRGAAQEQHRVLWEQQERLREQAESAEKKIAAMREMYLRRTAETAVWKGLAPPVAESQVQQQVEAFLARHRTRGEG